MFYFIFLQFLLKINLLKKFKKDLDFNSNLIYIVGNFCSYNLT
jgi:hypothetical protein